MIPGRPFTWHFSPNRQQPENEQITKMNSPQDESHPGQKLSCKRAIKAGFHWRQSRSWSPSRSLKSASNLVKIENRSRKRSHKLDGIKVARIRTVPFSSDSAYDSDAYDPVKTGLLESQAEAVAQEPTNHNARIILRLLLTTPVF